MTEPTNDDAAPDETSCREATRLVSLAQERPLSLFEQERLAHHLADCGICRRYQSQVELLRRLMQTLKK